MVASWGRGSFLDPGADGLFSAASGSPMLPSLSSPTCTKWLAADPRGLLAVALGVGRQQSSGWDVAV